MVKEKETKTKTKKTTSKSKKEEKKEAGKEEKKENEAKTEAKVKESKPAKKGTKKKRKSKKKKTIKVLIARGKRKESVARATIKEGSGIIRLNSQNVEAMTNRYIKEIIKEPLKYVGPEVNNVNISINVKGGGVMGQAQAARTAIANALVNYFDDLKLKEKFISIDRSLVVEDTRRVEPKKYRGPKARARYQKSYR